MLTEAQKQELVALAQSLESQGKSQQEVQAAIDSKKAEMLGENTVKEATEVEPIAIEKQDSIAGKVPYSINNREVTKEEFDNYAANEKAIDIGPIIPPKDFDVSTLPETAPRATEKEIKAYEKSVQLDKEAMFEGELRRIKEQRKLPEEMTATEKMAQSMENMYLRIQNIFPKVNLSSGVVYRKIFGDENVDKFVNAIGKDTFWTEGLTKEETVDAARIVELNQQKMGPTGEIIKGFKNADAAEVLAGTVNAGTALIPSMLEIMAGGGTSAVLMADFFADSYKTINTEKAESEGKTLEKLIQDGEDETLAPAVYSTTMSTLEKIGFDKIAGVATKKLTGSAIKKLANFVGAGSAEMTTEVLQTSLEKSQEEYGKTGSTIDAAAAFVEALDDQETWEAGVQGFVGGAGFSGAGNKDVRKAISSLRAPVDYKAIEMDIEKLSKLNNDLAKAKDPEIIDGIKNNINEVKQNLSDKIIKGNSIIELFSKKDIDEINNMTDLAKMQVKRVKNLEDKLSKGDVTIEEYNSAVEGYKASFVEAKNRIKGIAEDAVLEAQKPEGVSKVSFENARAINKAYENNPGSIEVFNNVVIPKMQPLINKVTNSLFKEYGEFKEGTNTRADFISNLTFGMIKNDGTFDASSLRGLYKSFRPEEGQRLSTYIENNLRNRGKRVLDKMVNPEKQATEGAASLEAPQVRELTSDERVDFAIAEDRIDTGKNIGLKLDDNKVKKIVSKHYNPDAKKFKSQIANDFKVAFKEPIDKFFGTDKVSDKQFSNKVTQNAGPLYDMLTVEGMRMARGVDGVNPFEEAGMLVFKDGKLEKAAFENTKVNALLDYLNDPSVAKNTRSNRKIRFKEAVAVSVASSQAIKALSTDIDLQTKYKDLNRLKAEISNNIDKKGPLSQFIDVLKKIGSAEDINEAAALSGIKEKVTVNDNNRAETQESVLNAIKNYGLTPNVFESAMPASSGAVRTKVGANNPDAKKLAKFLEKNNKKAKDGTYYYALNNGDWVEAVRKTKADGTPSKEVGPPPGVDNLLASRGRLYYGKSDPKYIAALEAAQENLKGKTEIKPIPVTNNFFSKSQQERSKVNMNVLEDVANQLSNAVNSGMDPSIAALLISQGYQATAGLIKIAAQFKYKSKKFEYGLYSNKQKTGLKYREEHNPPASVIGANLIWAITNNKVKEIMPYIRKNYYQTQLSKKDDERLDIAKLDKKLPEGFSILDDSSVRLAKANIDLNTIVNMETGKTMAQELNVEGPSTPDAIKAANEVVTEDKIEFVIDRAIAKLTELTGTKGFAIDPFLLLAAKDVSLNVLVGGLRTLKATYKAGKSLTKAIDAGYQNVKKYMSEAQWLEFAKVATQEIEDVNTPARARLAVYNEAGVAAAQENIRKEGEKLLQELGINTKDLSTDEINKRLGVLSKAKAVAMDKKAPKRKARVFDFDDTLAKSKSNVLYLLPDGTTGSLTATEFAEQSGKLAELGAQFDFSEFSTVKNGQKGPLAVLAKKLTEAKGDRDVFVLTARPAAAAESIKSFLRSALGISIPLENITGLGDGTAGAKAYWMAEKVSEGYNDLFFADDAPKNVAAVDKMLTDLGVKKKVQLAKEAETKSIEDEMDTILRSKKPTKGSVLRKLNIYVPPGADDFAGLLYTFLGKGATGNAQMKFFQDNIMTPFAQGISAYETAKVTLARDYKALKKRYKNKKVLKEKVLDGLYTKEQAVRAYLYNGAGYDLDISKADAADLLAVVAADPKLKAFADDLAKITKIPEGYPSITPDWLGGSIQTDLANVSNKAQRAEFLKEFINNKDQMFSDQNIKLIRQMHGNDFTDALENVLERMETGVNRKKGKDKEFNQALNWLNASVANIMAFNTRSAILQQLSAVNFMNWTFNNPFMMAKAMANVPQFAKDFGTLFNSDFLLERRGGLKIEINTADLANTEPGNWFTKTHKKLLQAGFLPTQYGDSFAIAFGGATWYRNNINRLTKEGVSEADAIKRTMLEFQEIAETSQQSSRPDKVSRQQASDIGRLILAFANTPMQYARLTKKAVLDLANGRGDWKTNASKIVYYGVAQNLIFTALQSALFSMLLDDDDEVTEDDEKKLMYAANSIIDGTLRGMGYAGATIAALKNLGMELYDQNQKREKGKRVYNGALTLVQKGLSISPPLSKKIGDIVEAQRYQDWRQYKYSPFYQNYAKANYVSGILNVPVDRVFKKLENMNAMSAEYNDAWQNVLLGLGWSPYSVNVDLVDIRDKRDIENKSSPLDKKDTLEPGVLGKAHKDGSIQVKKGLSPAKKKEVIAHEKKHIADMKSGKLNYDNQNVYWNGKAYPRLQGKKIVYNGVAYLEGHKKLPWEKSANGIKV